MEYEKCTQRKLRALFSFLDKDGDGRISRQNLFNGITQLQSYLEVDNMAKNNLGYPNNVDMGDHASSILCEYEIEELLRCVPSADDQGGVTLEAFLESEKTLLPKLTRLRLLA